MKIALDHDSTLAETSAVAFDLICGPHHDYTMEDVEDWTWGFREFGKEAYLNALWHAWTLRPLSVPPLEANLNRTVDALKEEHEVHVVTAHPDHLGIEKGKKEWLAHHDIEPDEFHVVPTTDTKAALDYDIYIDDKPALPSAVDETESAKTVYLRDQAYNRDADGTYTRVQTVAQAAADILDDFHPAIAHHDHIVNVTDGKN